MSREQTGSVGPTEQDFLEKPVTLRTDRGTILAMTLLLLGAGGGIGYGISDNLRKQEISVDASIRAEKLASREEKFTGTYNAFVAALGEEAPEPITQTWIDERNYRFDEAQRRLRYLCTRSDEATWLDKLPEKR